VSYVQVLQAEVERQALEHQRQQRVLGNMTNSARVAAHEVTYWTYHPGVPLPVCVQ